MVCFLVVDGGGDGDDTEITSWNGRSRMSLRTRLFLRSHAHIFPEKVVVGVHRLRDEESLIC